MPEINEIRTRLTEARSLIQSGFVARPLTMIYEAEQILDAVEREMTRRDMAEKRDLGMLGGMMLGYGIGRASQMPDPAVIGVGLITAAETMLRLVAPEEAEVEGTRKRMAEQGIINAWEERRALARKVWTYDELAARGFRREHLGDYKYRLNNGGLEFWNNDWDEGKDDWLEFDPTAGYEDGPRMTLEALEAWMLSNL